MTDFRADPALESYLQFLFQNKDPLDPICQVEKGAANGVLKLDAAKHAILDQLATGTAAVGNYLRGDGSWSELNADDITAGTLDGDRLAAHTTTKMGGVPAAPTPTGQFLKDDGTWATVAIVDDKVKSDATDPAAGYLDAKVDGTTIEVDALTHVMYVPNDAITYAKIQNVSATDKLLGRSSLLAGDIEEIDCTAAGRALLDDLDATAQRSTLGLGGAAVLDVGAVIGTVCAGDDARLSDARTPVAHNHLAVDVTDLGGAAILDVGTTTGTVCAGDDSRLSDARTPVAHVHPAADIDEASWTGLANYVLGVNNTPDGLEYKQMIQGEGISITHGAGTMTIANTGSGGSQFVA